MLLLHSNGIHMIPEKTFADLRGLQVLKLSYNKVRRLQKNTFYGLGNLTRLHVDHNNLEFISPETFYGLAALRLVQLEGNQLTKLHPDTFVTLRYLEVFKTSSIKYLHLSDNLLSSLPRDMISSLSTLESLYLHGNPWTCDCHLSWLAEWMQEMPGIIKCKKDRNPSSPQQCPLCANPRTTQGQLLAALPAAAFRCAPPVIEGSQGERRLNIAQGSVPEPPGNFEATLGSLALNLTDQAGNEATLVCSVGKPAFNSSTAVLAMENGSVVLDVAFSVSLVCNLADGHLQTVWQVLAPYSDAPLLLERGHPHKETPILGDPYRQVATGHEDTFTDVQVTFRAQPSWLMQARVALWLDRAATTPRAAWLRWSSQARLASPSPDPRAAPWTLILKEKNVTLERTVLAGRTVALHCPGLGDPAPRLEWLLADGSRVTTPHASEDGRILIHRDGTLELRAADASDTGTYRCISTTSHDVDMLTYWVMVVEHQGDADLQGRSPLMAFLGESLDLPCHATGSPDPGISWVLPGAAVLPGPATGRHILSNGTLRIVQITHGDQGLYRCIAANPYGVDMLTHRVAVWIKGQGSPEQGMGMEGSGLGDPEPSQALRSSPAPRTASGHLIGGQRWGRFREQRRQRLSSVRRIDPRHWAVLLEKAKRRGKSQAPGSPPGNSPAWAVQLLTTPLEESSGSSPLGEKPGVPAMTVNRVYPAGPWKVLDHPPKKTPVYPGGSPLGKPLEPPPGKPTEFQLPGTVRATSGAQDFLTPAAGRWPNAQTPEPLAPSPLPHRGTASPRTGHTGTGDHLRGGSPVTSGTKVQAGRVGGLPGGTKGHQSTVVASAYPHPSPEPSPTVDPSGRVGPAQSQIHSLRSQTTPFPTSRPFARQRRIWGRGPLSSPHRTPAGRQHRYSLVKPRFRGAAEGNSSVLAAPEISGGCPSCRSAEPPLPSPAPVHPLKMDLGRVPQAPVSEAPLLWKGQPEGRTMETPAVEYFGTRWTQVVTQTATSTGVDKTPATPRAPPSVHGTDTVRREAFVTPSLPYPQAKPSVPTAPVTRKKVAWHHGLARSPRPRKGFRALHRQKGPASATPNTAPAGSPHHATALQATRLPPFATHTSSTAWGTVQTRPPRLGPMEKALPSRALDPTVLYLLSPESSGGPLLVHTVIQTTTAVPQMSKVNVAQTDRTGAQISERGAEQQGERGHPHSPRDAGHSSPTTNTMDTLPDLTPARIPAVSSTPVFTQSSWENTEEASNPTGQHLRTRTHGAPRREPGRTQTLEGMGTLATVMGHQSTPTSYSSMAHSPLSPALSPGSLPAPTTPSSPPWGHPSTPPVSKTMMSAHPRIKAPGSSSPGLDPEQPVPEMGMPPGTVLGSNSFTSGSTHISHPLPPFPPATIPIQPRSFQWPAPPWYGEDHLGRQPDPAATMASTHTLRWSGQQTAEDSGSQEMPVRKTTPSMGLSFDPRARNLFERPRIIGGRAASYTVLVNSDAFLPCVAVGNPLPTLRWTRVSSGLDLSGRKEGSRFRVLANGTLSIQRVDIQDRGQYLCSASNDFGSDHLYVTLSVISYPPRILESLDSELLVHSGSTVVLPCRADGRPHPSISWTLPNQTVVEELPDGDGRVRVTWDGTLVLRDFGVSDQGFYCCTASNVAGQDWLQVRIQVIATLPVILEPKRQEVVGTWGHSLRLPCTATGAPQPSVRWILPDDAEVRPWELASPKLLVFANGTLQVSNVTSSEQGTYKCMATSPAGSETRVVLVTVEPRKTLPRIDATSPTWTEVDLGGRLLLDCVASGEPKPRILWRLPSKAVVEQQHRLGNRIHVYPNGSLFIDSATDKDEGDYLCVARSPSGEDLVSMHVGLRRKAAQIAGEPQSSRQVPQGGAFRLDCPASGLPLPDISWMLPDGTVARVEAQGRRRARSFTLFDNGTLYLSRVGVAEQGDYTCHAQNTLGKDEMRVRLTVIPAAPRIRPGPLAEPRVQVGDTAILDCEVPGGPPPTRFWLLPSGVTITASKDRYVLHANGSLAISQVTPLDLGTYLCVARNPGGSDTKTYRLDVVPAPLHLHAPPANSTVLRATAVRHSRTHLDCGAHRSPTSQVTWLMPDDVVLRAPYHGGRISVHNNGTLEIRNVRPSDAAEFVCVARGPGGVERTLVVRLEVLEPPRRPTFRSPFHEKVVAWLGQPTTLDCSADGNPPPEILWFLPNGTRLPWVGEAGNGSLVISRTARSHAGRYRCAARNQAGYIEKLIVVEVGQRPVILTPSLGSVYGLWGKSISLHCVSDGSPKPRLTWTVPRGTILERPGPQGPYVLHENGTLVIRAAEAHDSGSYVCQAHNSVGHARITVPVTVVAYPPRITRRPPRSVLARIGATVQLSCRALGVPLPQIMWEMTAHPLLSGGVPGSDLEPISQPGNLILRNPQIEDSGVYKCTARNSLGSDSAATFLQVI